MKQILNIDSDSFSTTVLQDVQKIRIQESDFENSVQSLPTDKKKESLKSDYPTYFEYSMGGNLKFYKEHLQQDFELEKKVSSIKNPRQQPRKTSHSDNDSEPESLRYSHKPQERVLPVVNTIAEEPELSFDDYSSIYQPEFMLNINSQSLAKEIPKHSLDERVYDENPADRRGKKEHKISSWSQDFIEESSPENVMEHVEVHIVNKSEVLPREKENFVLTKHHDDVFDYQSSLNSLKIKTNCKQLNNQEINRSKGNQEIKLIKSDKNNAGTKKQTASPKPRQPKAINSSVENRDTQTKNILSKESSPAQKQRFKDKSDDSAPPLRKPENIEIESRSKIKKPVERKEKSINSIQKKKFDNEKHTLRPVKKETLLPSFEKNEAQLSTRLSINPTVMFDNSDFVFDELSTVEKKLSEPKLVKDADFYPESPISEVSFFKTPCSTRHNSLETFEQLESECIKDSVEEVINCIFIVLVFWKRSHKTVLEAGGHSFPFIARVNKKGNKTSNIRQPR